MVGLILDAKFVRVIEAAAERVRELGFRRQGASLRFLRGGNAGIIDFQKSVSSSKAKITFTINLSIVCGRLLDPEGPRLERASGIHAHLRERIGMLMPEHRDKWWEITDATSIDMLAREIAELVATKGAPYLLRYIDGAELVSLWESGSSPGLTEKQRMRYLEKARCNGVS
jgi:hypothetical protein